MSGQKTTRTASARVIQVFTLLLLFALLFLANQAGRGDGGVGVVAGVGFLLLAGTILAELAELVRLPHLSGYILAGVLAGPHLGHLLDHDTVERMSTVNTLALALIALAGGAELKLSDVRRNARSLSFATLLQFGLVLVVMTGVFYAAAPLVPFAQGLPRGTIIGIALLWGVIATTRSPSATLAILSQTKAHGPLSTFSLAFIMLSDVVVVVLLAAVMAVARPLIEPGASLSFANFQDLGHEILGSVALGTTLGLVLALYLRLLKKPLLLVLIGLGFGFSEVVSYLRLEPLLTFIVAGFVVQNLSRQGDRLLHEIEKVSALVFVLFFAAAGAHLDLPLLGQLWPVALLLAGTRGIITWVSARMASKLAKDPPVIGRWGWAGLVSQAGLTLGVAAMIERTFPTFGAGFRALVIATVAINELIGPVLFKLGLDRAGETQPSPPDAPPLAEEEHAA